VVEGRGARRLIKTVRQEWMSGGRRTAKGGTGIEGGDRTRHEQRTGTRKVQQTGPKQSYHQEAGGFLRTRGDRVKRRGRGRVETEYRKRSECGERGLGDGEGASDEGAKLHELACIADGEKPDIFLAMGRRCKRRHQGCIFNY
jgi:hypothetical protein